MPQGKVSVKIWRDDEAAGGRGRDRIEKCSMRYRHRRHRQRGTSCESLQPRIVENAGQGEQRVWIVGDRVRVKLIRGGRAKRIHCDFVRGVVGISRGATAQSDGRAGRGDESTLFHGVDAVVGAVGV